MDGNDSMLTGILRNFAGKGEREETQTAIFSSIVLQWQIWVAREFQATEDVRDREGI